MDASAPDLRTSGGYFCKSRRVRSEITYNAGRPSRVIVNTHLRAGCLRNIYCLDPSQFIVVLFSLRWQDLERTRVPNACIQKTLCSNPGLSQSLPEISRTVSPVMNFVS